MSKKPPNNDAAGVFYQEILEGQYSFSKDEKGREIIHIKTGDDFPYRIKKDGGVWELEQGGTPRVFVPQKFRWVGSFISREDALIRIVIRHNKSCKHMTHWVPL